MKVITLGFTLMATSVVGTMAPVQPEVIATDRLVQIEELLLESGMESLQEEPFTIDNKAWVSDSEGRTALLHACPEDWKWHEGGNRTVPSQCFNFNLFFLKGPKTGSSTMGGLARRIGARHGLNCVECARESFNSTEPHVVSNHLPSHLIPVHEAKAELPTFKWGMSRDPVNRCLSAYYMHRVTRAGDEPSPEGIMEFARSTCNNFIWKYYDLDNDESRRSLNFVAVTERFAESSVALAYVLGLSLGDILYVSSKVSAQKVEDLISFREKSLRESGENKSVAATVYIHDQPPVVQEFFKGEEFMTNNKKDMLLHAKAHQALDRMIDSIGADTFAQVMREYKGHLDAVKAECKVYSDTGARLDSAKCYWGDNGCAYECLDAYAARHGLWTPLRQ